MIKLEKYIPNFLTTANLFFGFTGLLFCLRGYWELGALMVFAGAILDFLDGWSAKLLNSYSNLGKQLDTLADIVTFGVLPAVIVHQLLLQSAQNWMYTLYFGPLPILSLTAFLIVAGAAFRLAKFNNLPEGQNRFSGLPSPAAGLFFASFPLIIEFDIWEITPLILNGWIMLVLCIVIPLLMVSSLHFMKFQTGPFNLAKQWPMYSFIAISAVLLMIFWFLAIPMIMILYLIFSLIDKYTGHYEVQS